MSDDDVAVTPQRDPADMRITRPFGLSVVRGVDCLRCGWDALAADGIHARELFDRHHCTGDNYENRT